MEIETYEATETTAEGQVEHTPEDMALIAELGLSGQQLITSDEGEINPYPKITHEQKLVCATLFDQRTKVADYSAGMIPVRILQVIAHAKDVFGIQNIYVYHKPTVEIRDPILVAGDHGNEYILARWGDALEPWADLMRMAREKYRETYLTTLRRIKAKADSLLTAAETEPPEPSFAWNGGLDLPELREPF